MHSLNANFAAGFEQAFGLYSKLTIVFDLMDAQAKHETYMVNGFIAECAPIIFSQTAFAPPTFGLHDVKVTIKACRDLSYTLPTL